MNKEPNLKRISKRSIFYGCKWRGSFVLSSGALTFKFLKAFSKAKNEVSKKLRAVANPQQASSGTREL
jgi:hypothetical protein